MPHLARIELEIEGPPPRVLLPIEQISVQSEAGHFLESQRQSNTSVSAFRRRSVQGPPEPYPQVLEDEEPDMLVISFPQVDDDSKPPLADHQFVSSQGAILQAPAPYTSASE
uniref:Uncharacterized protein n=1 Tax=Coccolithus braarudii TaxID=221442 RepID=A0A7S0Q507_9EUKA|mmetsp:Transcript_3802/g.8237  ORF Transcript_3802/g.8237 Transcript_3802/m.8237 type:complete len:112 (+) Transcript_3802:136-471(+)|eukprot:CAMPEP_0183351536 /NCGR_PEP_ID=MMETSP0164_2-20130417/25573_1 /TAXON_ID=221442 /ORGANISM="Coccolithus pelagicus ssp braarudi, Strain PLY182g" /LENGTH=111 /DNA_ID=CAMNT_0025523739 /DNA_START=127 /DNA_END=462 /DNA_ORIENTATION=+